MKPIPPWMIKHVGPRREERDERRRARLEIPLPPPPRDTREQPPIAEDVIVIVP
jgi:hypothetical protein